MASHETKIPGIKAKHAVITPACVDNRTAEGAFDEAVRRLREEYDACMRGWLGRDDQPNFHLVLVVERPGDAKVE